MKCGDFAFAHSEIFHVIPLVRFACWSWESKKTINRQNKRRDEMTKICVDYERPLFMACTNSILLPFFVWLNSSRRIDARSFVKYSQRSVETCAREKHMQANNKRSQAKAFLLWWRCTHRNAKRPQYEAKNENSEIEYFDEIESFGCSVNEHWRSAIAFSSFKMTTELKWMLFQELCAIDEHKQRRWFRFSHDT